MKLLNHFSAHKQRQQQQKMKIWHLSARHDQIMENTSTLSRNREVTYVHFMDIMYRVQPSGSLICYQYENHFQPP